MRREKREGRRERREKGDGAPLYIHLKVSGSTSNSRYEEEMWLRGKVQSSRSPS
jgi:hypothetical protein